ncbi:hypothetical protein [Chryseobacterium sp.]|nr:hypothetical protein [Chryseobacterium sp.]MBO9691028.1 hypothetical protein [Chryseobacterium sp.]
MKWIISEQGDKDWEEAWTQAKDWNEVTELYKLLLIEKFDVIAERVK